MCWNKFKKAPVVLFEESVFLCSDTTGAKGSDHVQRRAAKVPMMDLIKVVNIPYTDARRPRRVELALDFCPVSPTNFQCLIALPGNLNRSSLRYRRQRRDDPRRIGFGHPGTKGGERSFADDRLTKISRPEYCGIVPVRRPPHLFGRFLPVLRRG